jgi:hypothetical protein
VIEEHDSIQDIIDDSVTGLRCVPEHFRHPLLFTCYNLQLELHGTFVKLYRTTGDTGSPYATDDVMCIMCSLKQIEVRSKITLLGI